MSKANNRVKKTTGKISGNIVNLQIEARPIVRDQLDMGKWRHATRLAESIIPRRVQLYDMYEDFRSTDAQIIAAWGKRDDAVTSANLIFTDSEGQEVEEIMQLMDCLGFQDMLSEIIDSKRWGKTMGEPTFFINDNDMHEMEFNLIERKHYRPDIKKVVFSQTGEEGISYLEGIYAKTVMDVGKDKDLGLLLAACGYAILKRGATGDWASFIEKFGQGIIDGEWDGFNDSQRLALSKALEGMGSGGVIIRPAGTKVTAIMPSGNATGQLQMDFVTYCDLAISKTLLGTTETIESSSSSGYAQSETHQGENVKKSESDIHFVRRVLNSKFITVLKAAGFDTKGGTFVIKTGKSLSKKDSFAIHKQMVSDLGLPFSHDFFYEEYEMPKPDDYDQQIAATKEAETTAKDIVDPEPVDPVPDPKKTKVKKIPAEVKMSDVSDIEGMRLAEQIKQAAERFIAKVTDFFVDAPAETTGATNPTSCCGDPLINLSDSKVTFDNDALISRIYEAGGELSFDIGLFQYTSQVLIEGLSLGLSGTEKEIKLLDLGMMYGYNHPAETASFEMNIFKFSAAKTLAEAQKLNQLLRTTSSFAEFYTAAQRVTEIFNKTWLEAEYRTANKIASSAASYADLLRVVGIFPYWRYDTAGDNDVRASHRLLEGLILPANHPAWKKIFPPNGWNCRCTVGALAEHEIKDVDFELMESRVAAFYDSEEWASSLKQGFGVNRGDTKEVFSQTQMYVQSFDGKAQQELAKLDYKTYDLRTVEALQEYKTSGIYTTPERLSSASVLTDRYGKEVNVSDAALSTSDLTYSKVVKEAIVAPDEMWINDANFREYIIIKYFKDEVMIVRTGITEEGLYVVKNWEIVSVGIDEYRKGLLIHTSR